MKKDLSNPASITVVGLGSMGSRIAELFLGNDFKVTVWNRTASKADKLLQKGAFFANSISKAVNSSPFIVICVHDYAASNAIFDSEDLKNALAGKTVIQLTTGSPEEAKFSEKWFHERQAAYLDGAIQVAPDQMAQPDTTILVSGAEAAFTQVETVLSVLGGNITYLGNKAGLASAMDLATLSYGYGSFIGFFHGALIAEAEGIDVARYGSIVSEIAPGFGEFMKYEGSVIQNKDYRITQSPLSISIEAVKRIKASSDAAGISTYFPDFAWDLFKEAAAENFPDQELAGLIEVLRKKRGDKVPQS